MLKRVLAVILATVVILFAGLAVIAPVEANPLPWAFNPQMTVEIQTPQDETINSLPVLVSFRSLGDHQFSVSDDKTIEWARSFFYVVDGQDMKTLGKRFEGTKTVTVDLRPYIYEFTGEAYLSDLADGPHSVTVYYGAVNNITYIGSPQAHITYRSAWQATAQFYVNSKQSPSLAPEITPSPGSTEAPTSPTSTSSVNNADISANNTILYFTVGVVIGFVLLFTALVIQKRKR